MAMGYEDDATDDQAASDEEQDAAQDVLDAIKDSDAKALNLALKRHYALCAGAEKGEGDEGEG